jgi:hypothetical protein
VKIAYTIVLMFFVVIGLTTDNYPGEEPKDSQQLNSNEWFLINQNAAWQPRAGLRVVDLNDNLYLIGGRTPRPPMFPPIPGDSEIWGDVWKSSDYCFNWR